MCSKQRRAKKRARSSARKILRNSGMGKFRHALPSSAKSYFLAKSPLKSTGPNGGEFCVLLVKTEHCRKNAIEASLIKYSPPFRLLPPPKSERPPQCPCPANASSAQRRIWCAQAWQAPAIGHQTGTARLQHLRAGD
uniref:Ribosomal protein L32 n=1 Tax=Globodera rostochiensis TaxID=31243 RepID=A0A914I0V1_GLORO